jgi:hypothetical protein
MNKERITVSKKKYIDGHATATNVREYMVCRVQILYIGRLQHCLHLDLFRSFLKLYNVLFDFLKTDLG